MTREKEIDVAATNYDYGYNTGSVISAYCCFRDGAEWADKNPKSQWISVEDKLPNECNDMLNTEKTTQYVLAVNEYNKIYIAQMKIVFGSWAWVNENEINLRGIKYWMRLPKQPNK